MKKEIKLEGYQTDIHKDIIERCKKGDQKAQFQLYKLYSKAMFSICCRMMNNQEAAEDVFQEAFSEAFLKLDTFRYDSTFGAWLKKIIVNRCINALKKRKTALVLTDDFKGMEISETESIDENDLQLSVQKVKSAMEKLPDGFRVIFSLYMLEGYDHSEIAEIMGISESTSKSQLLRAKRKIKTIMLEDRSFENAIYN